MEKNLVSQHKTMIKLVIHNCLKIKTLLLLKMDLTSFNKNYQRIPKLNQKILFYKNKDQEK